MRREGFNALSGDGGILTGEPGWTDDATQFGGFQCPVGRWGYSDITALEAYYKVPYPQGFNALSGDGGILMNDSNVCGPGIITPVSMPCRAMGVF